MDDTIYAAAVKRAQGLKYKSFSQYVEHLVQKDVADRPPHVIVREEPGTKYPSKRKTA